MRSRLVLLAALLLTSGCAASKTPPKNGRPDGSASASLRALANGPGPEVALVAGASDFTTGRMRYSFLVVDDKGGSVERPQAQVWLARGLDRKPFERRTARLERVGVKGGSRGDVSQLYVVNLQIPGPGKYWVLAKPVGGRPIQGLGNLIARRRSFSPAIGSKAYPSRTPTLSTAGGDPAKVTTRVPPDRALLRYSISASLAAHKPFAVVFATPKFCTSRTCGPVVDVVDVVRQQFTGSGIRFIHVEIYKDNDPAKGFNRWVREWHLPTEPWVLLVSRDGRIQAKFEGSVSVDELARAVRQFLS